MGSRKQSFRRTKAPWKFSLKDTAYLVSSSLLSVAVNRQKPPSVLDTVRWVDETWLSMMKAAEQQSIGEARTIVYEKVPCFLRSAQSLSSSVTLVTQVPDPAVDPSLHWGLQTNYERLDFLLVLL